MDTRAAKLALARQKLKNHQEKKHIENISQKESKQSIKTESNENWEESSLNVAGCSKENLNSSDQIGKNVDSIDNPPIYDKPMADVNTTEILISNERTLELHINNMQAKLKDLQDKLEIVSHNYDQSCKKNINLENELKQTQQNYEDAIAQIKAKDLVIKQLNDMNSSLKEENNNLNDQLEFTKSMLTSKESENDSLHSQLYNVQNQFDVVQLQLQQLTNGSHNYPIGDKLNSHEYEAMTQKIANLEQQLKTQVKDYQQLNNHYEHYVGELNKQLLLVSKKNEELTSEIQSLSCRENSLIEQISDMEIRLQNYKRSPVTHDHDITDTSETNKLKEIHEKTLETLQDLRAKYEDLQKVHEESRAELESLKISKDNDDTHENNDTASLLKLNADITSDKIAAQRATEQNKKLKQDIQRLEDAFVKMSKDKLDLTEKITAEKFLNRELTIKLAEIEEIAKDTQKKIRAKDEEMIRLQTSYRVLEEKYNEIAENLKQLHNTTDSQDDISNHDNEEQVINVNKINTTSNSCYRECKLHNMSADHNENIKENTIPNTDAMIKLQDRFLKIMDEVADLSDEKHRLEHIITQLQNETETICEYVALYQQQRCLLKKRDEERTAQMKMFQSECTRLQSQLDELIGILTRFAEDKDLSSYFQVQTKHEDIQKVMQLLSKLKTNSLIDPQKSMNFNDFYPCSCCLGQLIEV